jgi:hypothetical protein
MKHARLSASAAERWLRCFGSVAAIEKLPEAPSSPAAAEGTLAHDIAAAWMTTRITPVYGGMFGKTYTVDGHAFVFDEEMLDGVQFYVDTCERLVLDKRWIELSLTPALSEWDSDLGGTADFVTYSPTKKLLRVVDFKYGQGLFVSADDNKQLKVYALGALLAINQPTDTVEVYIVQPRFEGAEPVRMQSFPAHDLLEFAGDIAHAAKATRLPDAPFNAGPWCRKTFCPNARQCPALEKMQHMLIKQEFSNVIPFDPKQLADALTAIPLVEERIKAIKEFAYAQAVAGASIPGYKLVEKRPRRHWTDEKAVVAWAEQRAINPYEDPVLKSPAQIEKGLKKPEKAELAAFTASVSSGTTLVAEGDARPAVSKMITVEDFEAIGGPSTPKQLTTNNLFE